MSASCEGTVARALALVFAIGATTACGRSPSPNGGVATDASVVAAVMMPAALAPGANVDACGVVPEFGIDALATFPIGAVGLYVLATIDEECTGLGGAHLTWKLVDACATGKPAPLVHSGGHGCIVSPRPAPGQYAVVASIPVSPRVPSGACLDATPVTPAVARVVVPMASEGAGRAALERSCPRPAGGR